MPTSPFAALQVDYIARLNELANASFTMAAVQTVNFAAAKGFMYPLGADTLQITLPAAPAAGDRLCWFSTNDLFLAPKLMHNGNNIESAAADLQIVGVGLAACGEVRFINSTIGWRVLRGSPPGTVMQWGGTKAANFNAASNNSYGVTANAVTSTLPASPAAGDVIVLVPEPGVTGLVLGANGGKINSSTSDFTMPAVNQTIIARWLDSTVGWLLHFEPTGSPGARFDATLLALRYWDGQRELAAPRGWQPYAYQSGGNSTLAFGTSQTLAVNGGSIAIPIEVTGHMLLDSISVRNNDTTLTRSIEWRLYVEQLNNGNAGENQLTEVPGANGTDSFTAAVGSTRTIAVSGSPVYVAPGLYWLVIRNTQVSNSYTLANTAAAGIFSPGTGQTKTLGSALASTLDFVAATWAVNTSVIAVRINGRVFGMTSARFT